jgi:tRNA threonylcarbamoyl adenosine modification protein (Sua5/YciO/YrdC/YwlC family)
MLLEVHPQNPQLRNVKIICECLRDGGIIIFPTDTLYGLGCDIFQIRAAERICRIKKIAIEKAQLSFICFDLSDLSKYCKSISTPTYRLLRTYLPGPYTFILPASREVPRILKRKKNTVGLRVPDHAITRSIVKELGHPVLNSSLPGEEVEEYTDPHMMYANFGPLVDIVVNGGTGGTEPSTVVDCTHEAPELIRAGLGPWNET